MSKYSEEAIAQRLEYAKTAANDANRRVIKSIILTVVVWSITIVSIYLLKLTGPLPGLVIFMEFICGSLIIKKQSDKANSWGTEIEYWKNKRY